MVIDSIDATAARLDLTWMPIHRRGSQPDWRLVSRHDAHCSPRAGPAGGTVRDVRIRRVHLLKVCGNGIQSRPCRRPTVVVKDAAQVRAFPRRIRWHRSGERPSLHSSRSALEPVSDTISQSDAAYEQPSLIAGLLIGGVVAFLLALCAVVAVFNALSLSRHQFPLGLPDGSIETFMALSANPSILHYGRVPLWEPRRRIAGNE